MISDQPVVDRSAVHLPNVQTFDGLLNLLSVCILVILGNVLDFRTYKAPNQSDDVKATPQQKELMISDDINSLSQNERVACCYARGVALYIMKWVRSCAIITDPDGHIVQDLPSRFLVQILNSLLTYKKAAAAKALSGAPHCTFSLLKKQALNVLECDSALQAAWLLRTDMPDDSLELARKSGHTIMWKPDWEPEWRSSSQGMHK
jgi:hypothetical protein